MIPRIEHYRRFPEPFRVQVSERTRRERKNNRTQRGEQSRKKRNRSNRLIVEYRSVNYQLESQIVLRLCFILGVLLNSRSAARTGIPTIIDPIIAHDVFKGSRFRNHSPGVSV